MKVPRLTKSTDVTAVLNDARDKSNATLATLRSVAKELFKEDSDLIIGVNGSVARREETTGSDVDLFVLTLSDRLDAAKTAQADYRECLAAEGIKMPADGGVFEAPLKSAVLLEKIGGEDDTNTHITRRMLYLLEGEWVANKDAFERLRSDLIARYIPDDLEEKKIVRFFLNDVIRYWRTICVDFEHKTADATKPRAIRLIKLRLSRMLLYVAGIAATRQTVGLKAAAKRETLAQLLGLPPLERLEKIHGLGKMDRVQALYATFLSALNCEETRSKLELPGADGLSTQEFLELAEVAREFKTELLTLLDMDAGKDPLMESLLL